MGKQNRWLRALGSMVLLGVPGCAGAPALDFSQSPCWTCAAPLCQDAVQACDRLPACAAALACQLRCPATVSGGPAASCVLACPVPVDRVAQGALDRVTRCRDEGLGSHSCAACPQPMGQCQAPSDLRDTFCQSCAPRPALPVCEACQLERCCETDAACNAEPGCLYFLRRRMECGLKYPLKPGVQQHPTSYIAELQRCVRDSEDAVTPAALALVARDLACGSFQCDYQGFCAADTSNYCWNCEYGRCQALRLRCEADFACIFYEGCLAECAKIDPRSEQRTCFDGCAVRYGSGKVLWNELQSCDLQNCGAECGTFPALRTWSLRRPPRPAITAPSDPGERL